MISEALHVIKGNLIWHYIKAVQKIDYRSIVLVLTGANKVVDQYAVCHLQSFVSRRSAEKVFIWTEDERLLNVARKNCQFPIVKLNASVKMMQLIFDYYCYDKFFSNFVFTYIDKPKDNMMGKLLSKSNVNEEELVCLGLYNLRMVPVENKMMGDE